MRARIIEAIVEGDGEQRAVPKLIKRIAADLKQPVEAGRTWRMPKGSLLRDDAEAQRILGVLAKTVMPTGGGIIVLWDADDDCPAKDGPRQQARLQALRPDVPVRIVIATREYEAWFLAGAADLAGIAGLPNDLADHADPEAKRDAKGWIRRHLPAGQTYRETYHQELFSTHLNVGRVRKRSNSFDKLCREIERLLR